MAKKIFEAKRFISKDEEKHYGCRYCYDKERTNPPRDFRKFMDVNELNDKINHEKGKRYGYCPHMSCPYADTFNSYESFEEFFNDVDDVYASLREAFATMSSNDIVYTIGVF